MGVSQIEAAEVFRLTLAVLVLPVFLFFSQRLRGAPWKKSMIAAYLIITFSYVVSILENLFAPTLLNTVQHVAYAAAGVCWLLVVLEWRREWASGGVS